MNCGKHEITAGLEWGMEIKKLKGFEQISQLGDSVSTVSFPRFFNFVPERLQSSFQRVSRTTCFIHIPGIPHLFSQSQKLRGFFLLSFSPLPQILVYL